MKFRGPIFFSILALAVIASAFLPIKNPIDAAQKETFLIQAMLEGLSQLHYQPQSIDDKFSEKAYQLYLERLDGGRRWLTQSDIAQLEPYKHELDNESQLGSFEFFDLATKLYLQGFEKSKKYYTEILEEPFDYSKKETVNLDYENKPFAADDAQLKEYWRTALKYETLTRVSDKLKTQEEQEEQEEGEKKKTFEELEEEARGEVRKTFNDWFDRLSKEKRADLLSDYLNAITSTFDPHTNYFLPKDKETFDINMSGTLEGIGARLQTSGQYTKVSDIIAGGPAWKGKELENDDLIMKVAQGDDEPKDVTGLVIDDVVKQIRGKKGTEVRLTVKKLDGTIKVISITRDVVLLDEGYAKSVILDLPGTAEQVGYIKLPRFYADFNRRGGRSCATDVGTELSKLKEQNVSGIILDLRNNGGGSLHDVVRMSGFFIEEGPVVQVKARGMDPEVLRDSDTRVQYDGKLIVLVNSYSASASEILAAALQDYDRAVIVGTGNSTFGKGTVQRFLDLDRAIRGNSDVKPLGEIKLTIQKFYRVNGGSTQLRGVTPDIVLPDRYYYFDTGEKEEEYAMPWTEIAAVNYGQEVYKVDNRKELAAKSATRIENNETFQLVLEDSKRLKAQRDKTTLPLNLNEFNDLKEGREVDAKKYKDILKENKSLKVVNLEVDMEDINLDESKVARNEEWIKNIKKDIYIEEALHILQDMK